MAPLFAARHVSPSESGDMSPHSKSSPIQRRAPASAERAQDGAMCGACYRALAVGRRRAPAANSRGFQATETVTGIDASRRDA